MTRKFFIILIIVLIANITVGQNLYLSYEPIKQDIKNGQWDNIDAHLDTLYQKYSDSIIVPFTLYRIGDELFELQDFNRLAVSFDLSAKSDSSLRRIKRFFSSFTIDIDLISKMLYALIPKEAKHRLTMDRTNWKIGENMVDILPKNLCESAASVVKNAMPKDCELYT